MAVSKRTRFEIFKRDAFTCQYCGKSPPQAILECDHVVPVSLGGVDDQANLVTSCEACNRGKSNIPLESIPVPLAVQQQRNIELFEQFKAYNEFLEESRSDEDAAITELGVYWFSLLHGKKTKKTFPTMDISTLRNFLRKLPKSEIKDAFDIAYAKTIPSPNSWGQAWRYFCGVCHRKIKRNAGEEV